MEKLRNIIKEEKPFPLNKEDKLKIYVRIALLFISLFNIIFK